jgi:hypothetical protein
MPTDLMVFKYGGHSHPPGEVNLVNMEVIPQFSDFRRRWSTLYRLHLRGELIYNGQAALHPKIAELIDVYAENGYTAGLYHTDGTPTRHFLDMTRNDVLTRTQVVYRSWPTGDDGEYTTARTFYIIIQALFDTNEGEIMAWRESLDFIGDGGREFEWVKTPRGAPIQQFTRDFTTQSIVQHGELFAMNVWPLGNVPIAVLPAWLHRSRSVIKMIGPQYLGNRYYNYGISWTYVMEAPAGVNTLPGLFF